MSQTPSFADLIESLYDIKDQIKQFQGFRDQHTCMSMGSEKIEITNQDKYDRHQKTIDQLNETKEKIKGLINYRFSLNSF